MEDLKGLGVGFAEEAEEVGLEVRGEERGALAVEVVAVWVEGDVREREVGVVEEGAVAADLDFVGVDIGDAVAGGELADLGAVAFVKGGADDDGFATVALDGVQEAFEPFDLDGFVTGDGLPMEAGAGAGDVNHGVVRDSHFGLVGIDFTEAIVLLAAFDGVGEGGDEADVGLVGAGEDGGIVIRNIEEDVVGDGTEEVVSERSYTDIVTMIIGLFFAVMFFLTH